MKSFEAFPDTGAPASVASEQFEFSSYDRAQGEGGIAVFTDHEADLHVPALLRKHRMELRQVIELPSASIDTWAPPPERS